MPPVPGTPKAAGTAEPAREHGIRRLHAHVLAKNRPMLSVLHRLGGVLRTRRQDMLTLELEIDDNLGRLRRALAPSTPSPPSPAPAERPAP